MQLLAQKRSVTLLLRCNVLVAYGIKNNTFNCCDVIEVKYHP